MSEEKNETEKISNEAQQQLLQTIPGTPGAAKGAGAGKDAPLTSAEFRIQRLLKHHELAIGNKTYSVSRFDILVISISGGGIYIVFEALKFYKEQTKNIDYTNDLLTIAGLTFTVSIILNFLSQWTCFNANKHEERWANQEIKKMRGEPFDEKKLKMHDTNSQRFNTGTSWLNISSALIMFAGIIVLALFISGITAFR